VKYFDKEYELFSAADYFMIGSEEVVIDPANFTMGDCSMHHRFGLSTPIRENNEFHLV